MYNFLSFFAPYTFLHDHSVCLNVLSTKYNQHYSYYKTINVYKKTELYNI